MKFIATADIHLGWKLFNIPELAEDLKDNVRRLVDIAIGNKVNIVLIGDTFDNSKPSEELVCFMRDQISKARKGSIDVLAIAGDHDMSFTGKTWITDVCGATPIQNEKTFIGLDYQNFFDLPKYLNEEVDDKKAKDIEFIFFHGQVPELFPFTEAKKTLNFKDVKLERYPNLKGVILGDIHKPIESTMLDDSGKNEIYIGFAGSLGMVKTDEIGTKTGLIFHDGDSIKRIPFPTDRLFFKIDLSDDGKVEPVEVGEGQKKPVYYLTYSQDQKEQLKEYIKLYSRNGIVRWGKNNINKDISPTAISIRSEINSANRISDVLKDIEPDEEIVKFCLDIMDSQEPKSVLDQFKQSIYKQHAA